MSEATHRAYRASGYTSFISRLKHGIGMRRYLRRTSIDLDALHRLPESAPPIALTASKARLRWECRHIGYSLLSREVPRAWNGLYRHARGFDASQDLIVVHPNRCPSALLHEFGHWVDRRVISRQIGGECDNLPWASSHPVMDDLFAVIEGSDQYAFLAKYDETYMLQRCELFARVYEQWAMRHLGLRYDQRVKKSITTSRAQAVIDHHEALGTARYEIVMPTVWDEDEFVPIQAGFEDLLRRFGLI